MQCLYSYPSGGVRLRLIPLFAVSFIMCTIRICARKELRSLLLGLFPFCWFPPFCIYAHRHSCMFTDAIIMVATCTPLQSFRCASLFVLELLYQAVCAVFVFIP